MDSVEVQPLSLYRNEVSWTKEHHSLLEKGDNSWCHFRPTDGDRSQTPGVLGELEMLLGTRQGEGTWGRTKTKETHSKIRLKVRIHFICICATVIKGTIAQCVMLH